ncbi:MAG: hypothetical protein ABIQ56_02910 [Chitinophagaceae bacterium]
MSQAFIRESDEIWLHEIAPTLQALVAYLTRENNGIRVNEKKTYMHLTEKRETIEMSNGMSYAKDDDGKWYVIP